MKITRVLIVFFLFVIFFNVIAYADEDVVVQVIPANSGEAIFVAERLRTDGFRDQQYAATANYGYRFEGWYENGNFINSNPNEWFYTRDDVRNITAQFKRVYNVIVEVSGPVIDSRTPGTVTPSGGIYDEGTKIELKAVPNTGCVFVGWYEGDVCLSTINSYPIEVTKELYLQARFELAKYPVSVEVSPVDGGTARVNGAFWESVCSYKAAADLVAIPNAQDDYSFKGWMLDGKYIAYQNESEIRIPSVEGPMTFTAVFEKTAKPLPDPTTYTISVSSDPPSGGVAKVNGQLEQAVCSQGSTATLTATAQSAERYLFSHWTKEGDSSWRDNNPTCYVTVTGKERYQAHFVLNAKRKLTVYSYGNGSVYQGTTLVTTNTQFELNKGDSYTFTFTPENSAYAVRYVRFQNGNTNTTVKDSTSYTVTYDMIRVADPYSSAYLDVSFEPHFRVSASGEGGTVTGDGYYFAGEVASLKATANSGYTFERWEKGTEMNSSNPLNFTVNADTEVRAVFKKNETPADTVEITAEPNDSAMGYVTGFGSYGKGREVTLKATANPGYYFVNWTENNIPVRSTAEYSFTANTDRELIANFSYRPTAQYTVTYRPGTDCAGAPFSVSREAGAACLLANQSFYKNGYTQTGWSRTQGGTKDYELLQAVTLNSDITLYPYWTKNVGTLKLTVNYSGEGIVYLNGAKVTSGAVYDISELQSYTFTMTPNSKDYYIYSINFAGKYWNANVDTDKFMVTYDMMKAENRTLTIKFDSVTAPPKTGDSSNILLWSCLFGLSAAAVTTGMVLKKKSKS